MELKHYFAILRRWGWIMLLCTVLAGITSYLYSSRLPVVYQSRARYLIGAVLDNANISRNDIAASAQVGQTYDTLVTSRPILESVIQKLNLNIDPDTLASQVSGTFIDTTQILSIRANANDPVVAANIANAIGDALIEKSPSGPSSKQVQRRQEAEAQMARLQESTRSIQGEIDQLMNQLQQTTDATAQRALIVRLDERRSQLAAAQRSYSDLSQMLQTSDVNKMTLVEAAVPVYDPIAPDIRRNVLAAVIAGLVLGLAAMMLLEYANDVIYTPEMLRKVTGLTYLGGLARHKKLRGSNAMQLVTVANPETLAAESYRILRTNLQIAGTDRHLPSLLVTSPSRGDGKTDVAANLAVVLARAGKRVILIDANLRKPQIAQIFGIPDQDGLAALIDSDRMPEPVSVSNIPNLMVVPAGGHSLNSSEILGSQRMYQLIQECKARADVVLIDSSPLWYSDALALAPQVDGVLLVVSSGATGRENTINAVESLRLVGARIIGTVLNRVKAGPAYLYYPTFAAKRLALEGPSVGGPSVPALTSGKGSSAVSLIADQQDAGLPAGDAGAQQAAGSFDTPSQYATSVFDVTGADAANDAFAAPSDELVQGSSAGDDKNLISNANGHVASNQSVKFRLRSERNRNQH